MLLVEHKSLGKDLDWALDQAMADLPGIAERDLPQHMFTASQIGKSR